MKEAIRMVLESIYDPEFPDTSHFRSGRGRHSALRRIKEEGEPLAGFWNSTSGSVFTPSTDIDSSQSLRKRSTIPSSFTPFRKSFPPDDS
uniref:maturase K n=1 Tax=Ziziphus mauritiana TaxID=157914 RepID=UPI00226CB8BC|nr:maturase K [Ziziphus mauritiana]UZG66156.1 maturase K [Ziziphus mauritiana]